MFFIQDESDLLYLVLIHDKVDNADGGFAKVFVDAPSVAGRGVQVDLFDDIKAQNFSQPGGWYGQCSNVAQDCHSWDAAEGRGFMTWKWGARGSDGLVLGPLPHNNFSFDFSVLSLDGITGLNIGSWDSVSDSMLYASIPTLELIEHGLQIRAIDCTASNVDSVINREMVSASAPQNWCVPSLIQIADMQQFSKF